MSDGIPGDPSAESDPNNAWKIIMIGGVPYFYNPAIGPTSLQMAPSGWQYMAPTGPTPTYHTPDWYVNTGQAAPAAPRGSYTGVYDWPALTSGGGIGGPSYMQYDPFSQQLQAAQLQESIRQANLSAGYDRSSLLNNVLSNPANVFSSWFQSRGQVPPYNAQLANILNIPGGGNPWFGAMPSIGETPTAPAIPTPQAPQAIPYASGGTYIPAEPAVAIGLRSGQPLFTFNENAPAQTENVKITPQKVPSFQEGGTAFTQPSPVYGWRGATSGQTPLSGTNPAPLADFYGRGGPQFPWLTNLGQGGMPGLPQLGNSMSGFPVPSLQSLNQMAPSEQTALANYFNTVQGVPAADVSWAARQPFMNLRNAIPAQNRMG